jgi:hypothetical protein
MVSLLSLAFLAGATTAKASVNNIFYKPNTGSTLNPAPVLPPAQRI